MTDPIETFRAEQDLREIVAKADRIGMISQADFTRIAEIANVLGPDDAERLTAMVQHIEAAIRQ